MEDKGFKISIFLTVIYALCVFAIGLYFVSVVRTKGWDSLISGSLVQNTVSSEENNQVGVNTNGTVNGNAGISGDFGSDIAVNNDNQGTDVLGGLDATDSQNPGDSTVNGDRGQESSGEKGSETVTQPSGDRNQIELAQGKLSQEDFLAKKANTLLNIQNSVYDAWDNTKSGWWFIRKKNHERAGSGQAFNISDYNAFYISDDEKKDDKVIYLTFDCGYPSANADKMLDTLKAHDIRATFFITGQYIKGSSAQVIRMREEGHNIGNHTRDHKYLPELSYTDLVEQITDVNEAFYEITGTAMDPFFRTPGGYYSRRALQMVSDLGYYSFMWSIAYGDYDNNDQPSVEYVIDHISSNAHNGAVLLMHMDSTANCEALDAVLTTLENQGYRFGNLYEFISEN